jgi:hypothetical protein
MRGDDQPTQKDGTATKRRARGASAQDAVSLVREAVNLLRRVEAELSGWGGPMYPLRGAAATVRTHNCQLERYLDKLGVGVAREATGEATTEEGTEGGANDDA